MLGVCVSRLLLSRGLAHPWELWELEGTLETISPASVPKGGQAGEQGQSASSSVSPPSSPPGAWGCISSLSKQELLLLTLQFWSIRGDKILCTQCTGRLSADLRLVPG